jgi:hypothetical protein
LVLTSKFIGVEVSDDNGSDVLALVVVSFFRSYSYSPRFG